MYEFIGSYVGFVTPKMSLGDSSEKELSLWFASWQSAREMKMRCKHCGTRYNSRRDVEGFCCRGCAHVYAMIQDAGLNQFYDASMRGPQPVGEQLFENCDFAWIPSSQAAAEAGDSPAYLTLRISGMSCLGCIWLVERLAKQAPGVLTVRASLSVQLIRLEWTAGAFSLQDLASQLQQFGYVLSPRSKAAGSLTAMDWRMLLALIFAANAGLLSAPRWAGVDFSAYASLFDLLLRACGFLSLSVVGSHLLAPLYQAWLRQRFSMDGFAGACLVGVYLASWWMPNGAWMFPILASLLLLPDWLSWRLGMIERFSYWPLVLSILLVCSLGLLALPSIELLGAFVIYASAGLLLAGVCAYWKPQMDTLD